MSLKNWAFMSSFQMVKLAQTFYDSSHIKRSRLADHLKPRPEIGKLKTIRKLDKKLKWFQYSDVWFSYGHCFVIRKLVLLFNCFGNQMVGFSCFGPLKQQTSLVCRSIVYLDSLKDKVQSASKYWTVVGFRIQFLSGFQMASLDRFIHKDIFSFV